MSTSRQKVFVLSLHRTGTKSTHNLLNWMGWNGIHFPKYLGSQNFEELLRGKEQILEDVWALISPFVERYNAFSDVPFPVLYMQARRDFPDAKFIYIRRDPKDWRQSVIRHMGRAEMNPYTRVQYWSLADRKYRRAIDYSEEDFSKMQHVHEQRLLEFFGKDSTSQKLFWGELQDELLGKKIAEFLGVDYVFDFPLTRTDNIYFEFMQAMGHFSRATHDRAELVREKQRENVFISLLTARSPKDLRNAYELLAGHDLGHREVIEYLLEHPNSGLNAVDLAEVGLERFPGTASYNAIAGKALEASGHRLRAKELYLKALELDKGNIEALNGLFEISVDEGDESSAIPLGSQIVNHSILISDFRSVAIYAWSRKRWGLAFSCMVRAIEIEGMLGVVKKLSKSMLSELTDSRT